MSTPHGSPPAASKAIPKDVLQILTIIAFQQPIPLLILVGRCGPKAFERVHFLEDRGLVGIKLSEGIPCVITTNLFADTFGLDRDVKKMQVELKMDISKLR